jgi:hypothetical protein
MISQCDWSSSNGKVSAGAAHLTRRAIPNNDQCGFCITLDRDRAQVTIGCLSLIGRSVVNKCSYTTLIEAKHG